MNWTLSLLLAATAVGSEGTPPNVLILLADDLGVDMLASYGVGDDLPSTPNLDTFAAVGVQFENTWANTICCPSRATLMTGRYSFRTGVGAPVTSVSQGLLPKEFTLPEMAAAEGYATGAFGKWHLGNADVGGPSAPNVAGWDHFEGVDGNIYPPHIPDPPPYDYFFYPKIENGVETDTTGYVTSDTVDWFLDWVDGQSGPWLAFVSFNAAHDPWHQPPDGMYSVDLSGAGDPETNPRPYFKAMVETVDFEVGRLLSALGGSTLQNTHVIFLGDNGTPKPVITTPYGTGKAKATLYEGGIRVPLIVNGPAVTLPGSTSDALVNMTDVFATVADIIGSVEGKPDSVSFLPYLSVPSRPSLRDFAYSERFEPNGQGPYTEWQQAVRDDRYKLIRRIGEPDELYDLVADPFESNDLLAGTPTSQDLRRVARLGQMLDALVNGPAPWTSAVIEQH